MKLIHCIGSRIGSHYKDEYSDEALEKYAVLKGIDPLLLVNEAKRANYDYNDCALLRESIKTNEDWREINRCYALVAWKWIQNENVEPTSFGMGVLFHKDKADLTRHYYPISKLYLSVSPYESEVRRTDENDIRTIRSRSRINTESWNEYAWETLRYVVEDNNNPRFNPEEMYEVEGKYLSYYYSLTFGNIRIVFHTTEKGFDIFSLIRSEIMNNLTPAARELLGEYAEIVH